MAPRTRIRSAYAIRQLAHECGPGNALFIHLTLIVYLRAAPAVTHINGRKIISKLAKGH